MTAHTHTHDGTVGQRTRGREERFRVLVILVLMPVCGPFSSLPFLSSSLTAVVREANETKDQLEEDIDKEVEQLKEKYDAKLATERDATLRLKGENGIMRKKFKALQKDIDDQTENIRTMYEKEEHLMLHIKNLEERINSHKNEIKERDKTIGENERGQSAGATNGELAGWREGMAGRIAAMEGREWHQIAPR